METAITCGGGGTCTLVIAPYRATEDEYIAVASIWGAVLIAACAIWGVKQIYKLLSARQE